MKLTSNSLRRLLLAGSFIFLLGLVLANAQTGPIITQNLVTNQTVLAGSFVTLSVTVSGTGPFTYQWQFDQTNLPNGIITTVAGGGNGGDGGDGGAATNASLSEPYGVAVGAYDNLFIADTGHSRIREVAGNGIITTVAGNGSYAIIGDGGQAIAAGLETPEGVALDDSGNLFIADAGDYDARIRKVGTNGIITTVAGGGVGGITLNSPGGVAVDADGNLLIADTGDSLIRELTREGVIITVAGIGSFGYSGDGGAAINASLHFPGGVAADAHGNLFIADTDNQRIRMVNDNGIITTVAGNGTNGYSGDGGAATKC
jgi:trimeric autotransporter adhesin